jgi:hypothetical protein
VYQPVGNAVLVEGSSSNISLRNNISAVPRLRFAFGPFSSGVQHGRNNGSHKIGLVRARISNPSGAIAHPNGRRSVTDIATKSTIDENRNQTAHGESNIKKDAGSAQGIDTTSQGDRLHHLRHGATMPSQSRRIFVAPNAKSRCFGRSLHR